MRARCDKSRDEREERTVPHGVDKHTLPSDLVTRISQCPFGAAKRPVADATRNQ